MKKHLWKHKGRGKKNQTKVDMIKCVYFFLEIKNVFVNVKLRCNSFKSSKAE